jgi:hypothetical protein
MPVLTSLIFDIRSIARVQRCHGRVQLTFSDDSLAQLEETLPHFDTLMVLVESEARCRRPVGVVLDAADRILDLNEANDVTVRSVSENEDSPDRVKVALWGFSPICYLSRDHPEFVRLHSLLATAVGTPTRLWLANYSRMVQDEPASDGTFESWWKIMDARLA